MYSMLYISCIKFVENKCCSVIIILLMLLLVYMYCKKTYSYWKNNGICEETPIWLIGNLLPRWWHRQSIAEFDNKIYAKNNEHDIVGIFEFLTPVLMVRSADILKLVTIKDFEHFGDRSYFTFNQPVMDQMLLSLKGSIWKKVRSAMTPSFTSGKIKQTFPLIKDCAENLAKYFHSRINKRCNTFEMKGLYEKFTMDTIASIAFGVSSDSLNNSQDEFSTAAARFFASSSKQPLSFVMSYVNQIIQFLKINKFDSTPCDFFSKVISDTIKYRCENGVRRNDFLQLLLDASSQECDSKKPHLNEKVLSELVITAQCLLFYIAGYDTTATTLSFVSYCLALNPKIQERVMDEIESVLSRYDGNITFESLQDMKYLDMVFCETLRLYPPAPRIDRRCTKDYPLPGTDYIIPKGMKIIIPIYSIHRDPQYYDQADIFDPERFSNKSQRVPPIYMPFGSGPRNCIGRRFAMMEVKLAMVRLLQDFAFIPSHRTEIPIKYDPSSGLLKSINGVWVRLALRC